ncbi:MAG: tol-pal system protein YbgF [Acidobacteria bacterium]|nr:tol-pal system protein YbgF [Acidobacteriota bacterium]
MGHRLFLIFVLAAMPAFPVAKEILQLQRDIALLQDQVRNLQTSFDKQLAVTQQLLNQNLDASNRLGNALAVLDKAVRDQEKVLVAPIANVNTRVDTLASQFQALRDAVEEMNSKLSKLQQQVLDIKNIVSTAPPPAAAPTGTTPGQPGAPPVSAETLFNNALRDYQSGNFNLAGPQFNDYVRYFPSSERAADAQYYLGEIFYQQEQFDQAVAAFDQVLERYPEGKRTPDAQYKKGLSLLKQGKRNEAAREFREVIRKFPRSPAATQAAESLKGLGASARPAPSKGGRRK